MRQRLRRAPDDSFGRQQRDLICWSLLAAATLLIALAAPLLAGRVYTRDDLGAFHLPIRQFYAEQLQRGEPFDWMPQLFAGFYLTGEGQAGTYHPLHLLLYRCLPLQTAMGCELLASYPFLFAGAWLLLRRWTPGGAGVPPAISGRDGRAPSTDRGGCAARGRRSARKPQAAVAFGALLCTFSGFNLLHFIHPNAVAVAAHIPWLLWAIDIVLRDTSRRKVALAQAGIALLTGSQLLLGYPQYVWFSLLTEAAYTAFVLAGLSNSRGAQFHCVDQGRTQSHCVESQRSETASHESRLPRVLIAKLAGLLVGGVQLLPTLDALMHSTRQSADASFAMSGSLHPLNLLQLVAPYLFADRVLGGNTHESGLYAGAVPLVLVVWLASRWGRLGRLRPLAWAVATFGTTALLLAFGGYTPLYRLQTWLPLVGRFRLPCRYIVLVHSAIAVLAAVAFALLSRRRRTQCRCIDEKRSRIASCKVETASSLWKEYRVLWCLLGLSIAIAVGGLLLGGQLPIAAWPAALAGPVLIAAAVTLVICAARGRRWAPIGLTLLAAADLGCYGWSYAVGRHTAFLDQYVALSIRPPGGIDRVWATPSSAERQGQRAGNQLTMAHWRRADGYAGLEPQRRLDYTSLAALRAADVRWVRRDNGWSEVTQPLPRVRLVTRARVSDDPARDIQRIDAADTVLTELPLTLPAGTNGRQLHEPLGQQLHCCPKSQHARGGSTTAAPTTAAPTTAATPTGTVSVISDQPGRLIVQVECDAPQLLVVAESFHSGWRATVDGRPQPVLRVNGDFLGCPLEPGEHRVEFAFRPRSLQLGGLDSLLGLGLVSIMVIGGLRRTRPPSITVRPQPGEGQP